MKPPSQTGEWGWLVWLVPVLPVLWLAAVLAQCFKPGVKLAGLLDALTASFENPLAIEWTSRTLAFCLVSVFLYALFILYYKTATANTRTGEEHGSALWENPARINAKYANHKNQFDNILLTENIRLGMDPYKHSRNLNVLVVGGSGSGKSRSFAMPSLLQAATDTENPGACSF